MATNVLAVCQATNVKGRIEVRVKRRNPSKKKGTIGKQLPNIDLTLREKGSTVVLATTKSKGRKDCAVFDHHIDPNKQYVVEARMQRGATVRKKVVTFGPPEKVGSIVSSTYRVARIEIWVHQYEYQLTLNLGDVDSIFANAANTRAGRKERLQVLGLLPRPLDHDEVDACFDYVWGTYMKRLVAGDDDPVVQGSVGDDDIDAAIQQWLPEFLVEKAKLPDPGGFAKLRVPGDYRVFHRDFDKKYFKEMQFTLSRGNRYDVERRFLAANPALGKIPITILLERREENSTGPWSPAPQKEVNLQLVPPDKLPAYGGPGGPTDLTGATSWTAQVSGAPVRAQAGKPLKNSRTAMNGGPGPLGYLKRHVTERKGDPAFAVPNKNDPQKDNIWCEFGGKRRLATDMRDVTSVSANHGENVFSLNDLGQFRTKLNLLPAEAPNRDLDPFTVQMKTNANGVAGVIFSPSLIGGDRYRFRAYKGTSKSPLVEAFTGTMVRWRTIRIARSLTVEPPDAAAGLHATILTELQSYFPKCKHKDRRYCGDCLLREGKVVKMDFQGYLSREFSKAYCELLVDKTAARPAHEVIDRACLKRAVDALQKEQKDGDQQGGIVEFVEEATLNVDRVTGTLNGKGTIIPKSVKVIVDSSGNKTVVLIDNGRGKFTGTGKQVKVGDVFRGYGTIAYDTGAFNVKFKKGVPADVTVKISYKLRVAIDLKSLIYWADKSPFLVNMHTPQAYNSLINTAKFMKIPTEFSVEDAAIGTGDGAVIRFEKQLPQKLVRQAVKLDGQNLPSTFITAVDGASKLTVFQTESVTQEVACDFKLPTGATSKILDADPAPGAVMVQVIAVGKAPEKKEDGIAIVRKDNNVQITADEAGVTVTWDPLTRKVSINYTQQGADKLSGFKIRYAKPIPLAAGKKLTVDYAGIEVYDNTNPEPTADGLGTPAHSLDKHLAKMFNFYFMIKLIRAIDGDNNGFMPGLIGLQAPLRDTWSSIYDPNGMHQGKGLCNGFFVFYGNRWRNAPVDDVNTFNQISLHEMSHCLYFNHFPSGTPFGGGARADLHDMFDNCMMGYGPNDEDLCGKCVAAYMGVNTGDARLGTWSGKSYVGTDSLLADVQSERNDPSEKKHVEPPVPAAPEPAKDNDDIMSMLLNCAVGKQVWDLAVGANGGVEPEVTNAGPTGTGMCDIVPSIVCFPTIARVEFHSEQEKSNLVALGGTAAQSQVGGQFVQFIGDWVGVQIFIMELGNLSKRYDFFSLDYQMQKGEVGLEAYVTGTERIEYDGGVTYVIRAYNSCKNFWGAPVCQKASSMKPDQSGPLDWDDYYDELPETHKGKYYGEWHLRGMLPFYLKKCPRLNNISGDRVQKVLALVTGTFGSGDVWKVPAGPMNLYGNDDACWTLLNLMYALDPDWDIDVQNRVLDWVKTNLALQASPDAMVRVQAVTALSITNAPDLT
jgi:hypothetical protein